MAGLDRELGAVIDDLALLLISVVLNPATGTKVRSAARGCLDVASAAAGRPVASWLARVLDGLHRPSSSVIRRMLPLRGVEYATGQAEAFTFCLQQQPPVVALNEDARALLADALALADGEDPALLARPPGARPPAPEAVLRLRCACIELMCEAVECPEFRAAEALAPLREGATACFFRQLTQPQPEVHTRARRGLQLIMQHALLPNAKAYLQTSLRPILSSLSTHKSLSLPLLAGLHRLLEQMSEWFNLTLGEKLLDHLARWLEPEAYLTGARAWRAGEEAEVAAAILGLFHLLPKASKFLESSPERPGKPGLVALTLALEERLPALNAPMPAPRVLWSPYRCVAFFGGG